MHVGQNMACEVLSGGTVPRAPDKCFYWWLCGKPFIALNLSFSICHICHPFAASAASDLWKET